VHRPAEQAIAVAVAVAAGRHHAELVWTGKQCPLVVEAFEFRLVEVVFFKVLDDGASPFTDIWLGGKEVYSFCLPLPAKRPIFVIVEARDG
jgi:hypothetical protein